MSPLHQIKEKVETINMKFISISSHVKLLVFLYFINGMIINPEHDNYNEYNYNNKCKNIIKQSINIKIMEN